MKALQTNQYLKCVYEGDLDIDQLVLNFKC